MIAGAAIETRYTCNTEASISRASAVTLCVPTYLLGTSCERFNVTRSVMRHKLSRILLAHCQYVHRESSVRISSWPGPGCSLAGSDYCDDAGHM
jgi:hypothetical protein